MKKLLKTIDETGGVARKEVSRRPKSVRTEENIELVEEMILSEEDQPGTHFTLAGIARKLNIARRSASCAIDQYLDLRPLRKLKVQKFTDSDIEKCMIRSRNLLSNYTQKTLQTAFFSKENIFQVK